MSKEVTQSEWNRFVLEGLVDDYDEHGRNTVHEFGKMCKLFGLAYMEWLKLTWELRPHIDYSIEDWQQAQGNVPVKFITKNLRGKPIKFIEPPPGYQEPVVNHNTMNIIDKMLGGT